MGVESRRKLSGGGLGKNDLVVEKSLTRDHVRDIKIARRDREVDLGARSQEMKRNRRGRRRFSGPPESEAGQHKR